MEIITHHTSRFTSDDIHKAGEVGLAENMKRDQPINHQLEIPPARKARNRAALARLKNRAERVPWPWEKEH